MRGYCATLFGIFITVLFYTEDEMTTTYIILTTPISKHNLHQMLEGFCENFSCYYSKPVILD